jgi:hypothetical protein
VTVTATRFFQRLATIALAFSAAFLLGSCGSGAVTDSGAVNDPTRITIQPGTGSTLYSGQPTTFVITGGTGSYIVSSSNQAVIPISGSVRSPLTVVPNPVATDTDVTLTVRDTGTTAAQTAIVTVKPGTINNEITITPSSTQGTNCPTGTLCSGGDAVVSVTLSQGGIALSGRTVRFDAISGDYRFITSPTGITPEVLATSAFVTTDEAGRASVRIRATIDAPNQTALLQATDVSSGAFRRVDFVIAQATGTSPGFFVTPTSYTFQGPRADQCASSSISASFFIFGGVAPYSILNTSSAFTVNKGSVETSGDGFSVFPNGQCADNAPIVVRDASGRTATVTVSNIRGTDAVPALVVSPATVSLSSCSSIAFVTAAGGTGNYVASSGSGALNVQLQSNNRTFQISRNPNSPASTSPVLVGISDGVSTVNVTVNLTGPGAGVCPTPAFDAQPRAVVLASCTSPAQVTLTGGSGNYTASTGSGSIITSISGNTLSIRRGSPSTGLAPFVYQVTASDGTASVIISVDDRAPVSCP